MKKHKIIVSACCGSEHSHCISGVRICGFCRSEVWKSRVILWTERLRKDAAIRRELSYIRIAADKESEDAALTALGGAEEALEWALGISHARPSWRDRLRKKRARS